MAEWIGRVVGNYRLHQQLGAGGMGQVFLGEHIHLQRTAAIKVLHAQFAVDATFRARFLQEARAIAALSHEHIVGVIDFGEQDGHFYLVMEALSDGSLRSLRRSYGEKAALPLPLALDLLRQAAAGLAHAHQQGFVHRDIKPDNLLLRRDQRQAHGWLLKITDFGLVRLNDGGVHTQTGVTMGTPAYMSPEQCQGIPLDGRSDVYSLGVVLFESVTGRAPFEVRSLSDAVFRHVYTPPPSPLELRPDLPLPLVELILRCLSKNPDERFPDASGLQRALEDLISRQPTRSVGGLPGVVTAEDHTVAAGASPVSTPPSPSIPPGGHTPPPLSGPPSSSQVITPAWVYTPVVEPDEPADAAAAAATPGQPASTPPYSQPPSLHPSTPAVGGISQTALPLQGSAVAAGAPSIAPSTPPLEPVTSAQLSSHATRTSDAAAASAAAATSAPLLTQPPTATSAAGLSQSLSQSQSQSHGHASVPPFAPDMPSQPAMRLAGAERATSGVGTGSGGPPSSPPSIPATGDRSGGGGRIAAIVLVLVLALGAVGAWALTRDDGDGSDDTQGVVVATDTAASDESTVPAGDDGPAEATATTGISAEDAAATQAVAAATFAVAPPNATANPGDATGGEPTPTPEGAGAGEGEDEGEGEGEGEGEASPPFVGPIVFASSRDSGDGTLDLWTMDADGQNQTPLITQPHDDWSAAWSPDGTKLAWANKTDGQNDDIWIADADGTDARQVTSDPGNDRFPVWTQDSASVVFSRSIDGSEDLFMVNAESGEELRLTDNAVYDGYVALSPDNERMAWTSSPTGVDDIWLMDPDGGSYALTSDAAIDYAPVWLPDGSRIFFLTNRNGNFDIFHMLPDGSEQWPLTPTAEDEAAPKVSPDGAHLAYVRREGAPEADRGNLYTMEISTGAEYLIASDVLYSDPGLVWAPDSSGLIFQRRTTEGHYDLWRITLGDITPLQLTNHALFDGGAAWQGTWP